MTNQQSLYTHLCDQWLNAKKNETKAIKIRKSIETEIQKTAEFKTSTNEKAFGSRALTNSLSMNIPAKRTWDHKGVNTAFFDMPSDLFPFKIQFKEDRKMVQELAEYHPAEYEKIKHHLTISHGSPSFSAKAAQQ